MVLKQVQFFMVVSVFALSGCGDGFKTKNTAEKINAMQAKLQEEQKKAADAKKLEADKKAAAEKKSAEEKKAAEAKSQDSSQQQAGDKATDKADKTDKIEESSGAQQNTVVAPVPVKPAPAPVDSNPSPTPENSSKDKGTTEGSGSSSEQKSGEKSSTDDAQAAKPAPAPAPAAPEEKKDGEPSPQAKSDATPCDQIKVEAFRCLLLIEQEAYGIEMATLTDYSQNKAKDNTVKNPFTKGGLPSLQGDPHGSAEKSFLEDSKKIRVLNEELADAMVKDVGRSEIKKVHTILFDKSIELKSCSATQAALEKIYAQQPKAVEKEQSPSQLLGESYQKYYVSSLIEAKCTEFIEKPEQKQAINENQKRCEKLKPKAETESLQNRERCMQMVIDSAVGDCKRENDSEMQEENSTLFKDMYGNVLRANSGNTGMESKAGSVLGPK